MHDTDYTLFERPCWNHGQLIAFSGVDGQTDYQHGLVARTISDTNAGIEITSPEKATIAFSDPVTGTVIFGGDFFSVETKSGTVRGAVLDAHHILIEGKVEVNIQSDEIRCIHKNQSLLIGTTYGFQSELISADLDEAMLSRSQWLRNRELPIGIPETRKRSLIRAMSIMKSQVWSPEGQIKHRWTTPDRWPHKDMWLWDTAFHAIGWRHVDPQLAMDMIDAMFDLQREDGFLTYRGTPSGPYFHLGDLTTQPPVLALAVKLVHDITNDQNWIISVYPKLCAYLEWNMANRDLDKGGLLEWFIEEDVHCRCGESGMDNSPRFDTATPLDAVDFNAYMANEYQIIAGIAAELGHTDEAQKWEQRSSDICHLIETKLWSEDQQFYFDYDPATSKQITAMASSGFLPLLCGAPSQAHARALKDSLEDPTRFCSTFPVPSIAISDTEHYEKDMWRGPAWINLNWLISKGFARYELNSCAEHIRKATISELEKNAEEYGTFFEYMDDRIETAPPQLLRKGENTPSNPYRQVIHEFGWSFTLYVDFIFTGDESN